MSYHKIKLETMEVGDVFYECQYGFNIEMVVLTKPIICDGQWKWTASNRQGETVPYLLTIGLEHYGPKIYKHPQYFSIEGEGLNFETYTK